MISRSSDLEEECGEDDIESHEDAADVEANAVVGVVVAAGQLDQIAGDGAHQAQSDSAPETLTAEVCTQSLCGIPRGAGRHRQESTTGEPELWGSGDVCIHMMG